MWEFSVGLYMITLWPDSLILPAIYGAIESASIAFLGPIIGQWVEKLTYIKVCSRIATLKLCFIEITKINFLQEKKKRWILESVSIPFLFCLQYHIEEISKDPLQNDHVSRHLVLKLQFFFEVHDSLWLSCKNFKLNLGFFTVGAWRYIYIYFLKLG